MTRNEFAAGLNACLNQVNQLVPRNKADLATREDFQILIERQIELNRELQQLNEPLGNPPAKKITADPTSPVPGSRGVLHSA